MGNNREGLKFWDKICALVAHGFLLSPDNKRVLKVEGVGNWIDKHDAQQVVEECESELREAKGLLHEAQVEMAQLRMAAVNHRNESANLNQRIDDLSASLVDCQERWEAAGAILADIKGLDLHEWPDRTEEALKSLQQLHKDD